MVKPGDVFEGPELGVRVEMRRTAAETGGELLEYDVVGRGRGFLTQRHVHDRQRERHEVVEGSLRLVVDGREHVLRAGEAMEVPAGTAHRQLPGPEPSARIRVQLRPAGRTEEFLERVAEMGHAGQFNRWGFPRPLAAARLIADFPGEGRMAWPSAPVQQRMATALLTAASGEYLFVDEWDAAAPREAIFDALADGRTYPEWWRPVYIEVDAEGEPRVGQVSGQHFKGRLPYHLRTRSRIVRLDRPHVLEADVDGDLRGRGTWTLTETPHGTHIRFDWRVRADRRLLRVLTPVLWPLFRWNHNWAIARAREGLGPFARRAAAT